MRLSARERTNVPDMTGSTGSDLLVVPTHTAGTILNFLGATAIGLGLLAPSERVAGRYGSALTVLLATAGIALAAVAFAFLFISEPTPLFGFKEPGYDPTEIAAARAAEIEAVLFLGALLVGAARAEGRACGDCDSPQRR